MSIKKRRKLPPFRISGFYFAHINKAIKKFKTERNYAGASIKYKGVVIIATNKDWWSHHTQQSKPIKAGARFYVYDCSQLGKKLTPTRKKRRRRITPHFF
jgi:hypothetical protein